MKALIIFMVLFALFALPVYASLFGEDNYIPIVSSVINNITNNITTINNITNNIMTINNITNNFSINCDNNTIPIVQNNSIVCSNLLSFKRIDVGNTYSNFSIDKNLTIEHMLNSYRFNVPYPHSFDFCFDNSCPIDFQRDFTSISNELLLGTPLDITEGGTFATSSDDARDNLNVSRAGVCPSGYVVQNATTQSLQCVLLPSLNTSISYGMMWHHNDTNFISFTPSSTGIFYPVNIFDNATNSTLLNNFLYANNSLKPQVSGYFNIHYELSVSDGTNNKLHTAVFVNNVTELLCSEEHTLLPTAVIAIMSGDCIYFLNAGDNVSLKIMDETATSQMLFYSGNVLIISMLTGTTNQTLKGDQGIQGINGTNGVNGLNGTNGINGTNGANGTNGRVVDIISRDKSIIVQNGSVMNISVNSSKVFLKNETIGIGNLSTMSDTTYGSIIYHNFDPEIFVDKWDILTGSTAGAPQFLYTDSSLPSIAWVTFDASYILSGTLSVLRGGTGTTTSTGSGSVVLNNKAFQGNGTLDNMNISTKLLFNKNATINYISGTDACAGNVKLSSGVATVNTACSKTNSLIFLTRISESGTLGNALDVKNLGNSQFNITANQALDTSTVAWLIINQQ